MSHIYRKLSDELSRNEPVILVTIVHTSGSTPQIPGSSALFYSGGLLSGTLGGGILEADAQSRSEKALVSGESLLYEYKLTTELDLSEGALCGGTATILLDGNPAESLTVWDAIGQSLLRHEPGVLLTSICLIQDEEVTLSRFWLTGDTQLPDPLPDLQLLRQEIACSLKDKKTRWISSPRKGEAENQDQHLFFIEPIFPLPHLIVAGAGHIGLAVSHLGRLLDFEVTVVDDRREFANRERLPDADHIIVNDIGTAMQEFRFSPDSFIVIVTRGHAHDAAALKACIGSGAAYIGMIGSRRKIAVMRDNFLKEGWASAEQFDSVYAPIGIDIQSTTVQEIALSICAQLVLVRKQKQAGEKPEIWGIILAAGAAKRMKEPKLLLPYNEKTIIETVITRARESKTSQNLVVLGADKEKVLDRIGYLDVKYCVNKNYSEGMLSSVQCGLRSLPGKVGAVIVILGDQPGIPATVTDRIIDAYLQSRKGIVVPVYNEKRGHPVLIDTRYNEEIYHLDPGTGLRGLLQNHPDDILEVPIDTPAILNDIDTRTDYLNEINKNK